MRVGGDPGSIHRRELRLSGGDDLIEFVRVAGVARGEQFGRIVIVNISQQTMQAAGLCACACVVGVDRPLDIILCTGRTGLRLHALALICSAIPSDVVRRCNDSSFGRADDGNLHPGRAGGGRRVRGQVGVRALYEFILKDNGVLDERDAKRGG